MLMLKSDSDDVILHWYSVYFSIWFTAWFNSVKFLRYLFWGKIGLLGGHFLLFSPFVEGP